MQPDWIIEMLEKLRPDLREDFEERAAIMEYDGNMPRDHAECLALLCVLKNHPMLGVHVLKLKVDGESQLFLTSNETYQRISATSCEITEVTDLESVLNSVFGGMAILGKKKILYEGKLF